MLYAIKRTMIITNAMGKVQDSVFLTESWYFRLRSIARWRHSTLILPSAKKESSSDLFKRYRRISSSAHVIAKSIGELFLLCIVPIIWISRLAIVTTYRTGRMSTKILPAFLYGLEICHWRWSQNPTTGTCTHILLQAPVHLATACSAFCFTQTTLYW